MKLGFCGQIQRKRVSLNDKNWDLKRATDSGLVMDLRNIETANCKLDIGRCRPLVCLLILQCFVKIVILFESKLQTFCYSKYISRIKCRKNSAWEGVDGSQCYVMIRK